MSTTADHAGDRPEDWAAPPARRWYAARPPTGSRHLADLGRVHIMGIAGSGMSALARILFDRGVPVSGCEARESITVAARALGKSEGTIKSQAAQGLATLRKLLDTRTGAGET